MMLNLMSLLELARPKQWVKNGFVFAALIFAKRIGEIDAMLNTLSAFVLFCLFSSCVYILNDVVDLERDRLHPEKRKRPLPSGRLSVKTAIVANSILFVAASLGAALLSLEFLMICYIYIGANLFYSFRGKSMVILDGMLIALGFVLRTYAGAVVIGEEFSSWLYICAIFVSLFLAFCKRRQEILLLGEDNAHGHRAILREYSTTLLDQIIAIVTAATLVTYSLYCIDTIDRGQLEMKYQLLQNGQIAAFVAAEEGVEAVPLSDEEEPFSVNRHSDKMKYSIPFVIYGLFRYLYLVYQKDGGGNPSELLLSDRPMLINGLLWLSVVLWVLYMA